MIITTISDKNYQRYVHWFVFFITKSYPEYNVKTYLTDEIVLKEAFEFVKTDNVVYVENSFPEYSKSNQELKTLLFLAKEDTTENVYIAGDVDVLICNESPSLEKYHLNLCSESNMIYNSCCRFRHKRIITGSHFVTPEYWEVMNPIIDKYRELHLQKRLNLGEYHLGKIGNEHVLYNMLSEAGLEIISIPESLSSNVLHGFHLGVWRSKKIAESRLIHSHPLYHMEWFRFFIEVEKTDEYKYLENLLPLYEISRMKYNMEKYIKCLKTNHI